MNTVSLCRLQEQCPGNRRVQEYNLKVLVKINTMKKEEQTMNIRLRETCTPYPSDQMTDGLTKDDPPRKNGA